MADTDLTDSGTGARDSDSAKICFWCGGPAPDTTDHVFPRCLFPDPMPPDVVPLKVPACRRHNGAFSRDHPGPWEITLAPQDSHRAVLGNVAAGWAEPEATFPSDELPRCPDPTLGPGTRRRRGIDMRILSLWLR